MQRDILTQLYYSLEDTDRTYQDNTAIISISGGNDDYPLIPEGLYNHLCSMNRILMDHKTKIQHDITREINKIGEPVLLNTSRFRSYPTASGTLTLQIAVPEGFEYSDVCAKEIEETVKNQLFPVMKKYINPQQQKEDE